MEYKVNPLKEVVNNFREYGNRPSLEVLTLAIEGSGVQSLSPFELETNLISSASKDEKHSFYSTAVELVQRNPERWPRGAGSLED